jgi:hypothetical protein
MAATVGLAITARPIIESTVTSIPTQGSGVHAAKAADLDAGLSGLTVRDQSGSYVPAIPEKAPAAVVITGTDQFNAYMYSLLRKAEDANVTSSPSDQSGSYVPAIPEKAPAAVVITGTDQFNAYMDSLLRKAAERP